MEQTENQIEDTSGLRGFKLIKAYMAALFRMDKSNRNILAQMGNNLVNPEIALTTRQSLFLMGVAVILNIVTLVILPHVLKGTIFDAHKISESPINFCGSFLYLSMVLPAWIFLGSFLFSPIRWLSKAYHSRF